MLLGVGGGSCSPNLVLTGGGGVQVLQTMFFYLLCYLSVIKSGREGHMTTSIIWEARHSAGDVMVWNP